MSAGGPVSESADDVRSIENTRKRMRPRPAGSGWAAVVVAIVLVVLFGLGSWVGLAPLHAVLSDPSDHEAVHVVAERFRARWPQVPGPPERYMADAHAALRDGEPAAAARRLAMTIAIDPDHSEALLQLAILDARGEADGLLLEHEGDAIVSAVRAVDPSAGLLDAASAWRLLVAGDPAAVEQALGPVAESEHGESLWARLRARRRMASPEGEPARLLLRVWPGHPEACEDGAREALRSGDLAEAERLAAGCLSGAAAPIARRVQADVMLRTGRGGMARDAYARAGLHLHAAGIAVQTGLDLTVAELDALAGPGPAAAVLQAWAAMSAGDAELLEIAVERIPDGPAPERVVTRAAAALWLDRPDEARALLGDTAGPRAAVLRAQLPGPGQRDAEGAARAAWPALPGGDDPVATAMLLGVSNHALPTRLLVVVGDGARTPLSAQEQWEPADARASELLRWLAGGGEVERLSGDGGSDALDAALALAQALENGETGLAELERLQALAPESVMAAVLEARAAGDQRGCVDALDRVRMPGLVGLDRERYRCAVRHEPASPR